MLDEFKLIPNNFPYAISKNGVVINTQTNKHLRSHVTKKGYLRTTFKGKKKYLIHRLVAITYIPNPLNLLQVNHIDGDKFNNNVCNLEWCDNDYNRNHAIKLGLWNNIRRKVLDNCGDPLKKSGAKLCKTDVLNIVNLINSGLSSKEISILYNVHVSTINSLKKGKTWNHITHIT